MAQILYPHRYDSWEASIGYPPMYEWEPCKYEGERGHVESMASMAELDQRGHYLQLVVSMNELCHEKRELLQYATSDLSKHVLPHMYIGQG